MDDWEVYEASADKCLRGHYQFWESRQYLLDKSIDIEELTKENIQKEAIQIWNLRVIWWYVDDSNPLTSETFVYKIVKNWSNYTLESIDEEQKFNNENIENENNYKLELVETEQGIDVTLWNRIIKFLIARLTTILIETIVLFAIAKLFRKNDQISNWRLLLIWILASTITLPLLRFVLPLLVTDEIIYMTVWELLVTLIEIFIIKYGLKVSRGKAILASIICNLCSYFLWLLIL
jgi:hypothetical protein